MLLVVRPGSGMLESGSPYMLLAALLISCTTIIIRHLSIRDDPVCITFYFTMTGILLSGLGIIWLGWQTPTLFDLVLLIAVGLLGGVAQYMMTLSYRHAEIAMVAPLKYLTIVFGGGFGYLLWSELPDLQSAIGIAIIALAGLYTLHREVILANRKSYE
jgi:drug/metabolite transporter (DMT)-like permease